LLALGLKALVSPRTPLEADHHTTKDEAVNFVGRTESAET
jgi:hypothetical protein